MKIQATTIGLVLALCGASFTCFDGSVQARASLLGLEVPQIVAALGVPSSVRSGDQALEFEYERGGDKPVFRVLFHAGKACYVTEPRAERIGAKAPSDRVYLGQSLAAASRVLGQPESWAHGKAGLRLHYTDKALIAAHGYVVGIARME